jgi:hypothetical protein
MTPRQIHYYNKIWDAIIPIQYLDESNILNTVNVTLDKQHMAKYVANCPVWFNSVSNFAANSKDHELWCVDVDKQEWVCINIDSIVTSEQTGISLEQPTELLSNQLRTFLRYLNKAPLTVMYIGSKGKVHIDVISNEPQFRDQSGNAPSIVSGVLTTKNIYTGAELAIPYDNLLIAYSTNYQVNFVPSGTPREMARHYYVRQLSQHICEVVFRKKDNTERRMVCTLDPIIIGTIIGVPRGPTSPNIDPPVELIRVMDIEAGWWRTINIANLISFEVTDKQFTQLAQLTTRDV